MVENKNKAEYMIYELYKNDELLIKIANNAKKFAERIFYKEFIKDHLKNQINN